MKLAFEIRWSFSSAYRTCVPDFQIKVVDIYE